MSSLLLPPPLAPWAPMLELFPTESALALGPLLRRLEGFIGPLRAHPQSGSMEPDGFDGLARRGSLERLLLSEWLLLEEAPLEFLRRFSQGESGYLQLARRDPTAARASLVLLDCGPDALGGPRLVQLAALLVLSRRAQNAGASFRWGAWQKPGQWQEAVSRDALEWWLGLRREGEPTPHERAAWEEAWQAEGADFGNDELWLLGSPALCPLVPPRARFLELRDELDPHAPNRAVETLLDGRTLRLELPEDAIGARLLRDPFTQTSAAKTGDKNSFPIPPLDQGLVWAHSGWKLFARAKDGALLTFSVPNSPNAAVGPPKQHAKTVGTFVAVGRVGRATVAASLLPAKDGEDARMRFSAWGRGSDEWDGATFDFDDSVTEAMPYFMHQKPLGKVLGVGVGNGVALWLAERQLFIATRGERELSTQSTGVRGVALRNSVVEVLRTTRGAAEMVQLTAQYPRELTPARTTISLPVPPITDAHAGWSGRPDAVLWALGQPDGKWTLQTPAASSEVRVDAARSVVGCLFDGSEMGLLIHTVGERELSLQGAASERRLFRFSSPITSVAACPFAPLVAVQGEEEVGVWSLPHGGWLLRARVE